jgi:sugar/nucleoside kinase (ribokinase family)
VISTLGAGDVFMGVVLAALCKTDFYSPAIAAALPDAVEEAARACERWGALE